MSAAAQSPGFWAKFMDGEFGLAKTYWLFGALPSLCVNVALRTVSSDALAYWIGAGFVCYLLVLLVALWRAGKRYRGWRIWPALALLMVLLAVLRNIGAVLATGSTTWQA